jgi:hypothetical protein
MALIHQLKFSPVISPEIGVAYDQTDFAVMDLSGFEGVMIVGQFSSTASGNYTLVLEANGSTAVGGPFTPIRIGGSVATATSTSLNKAAVLDIHHPAQRWIQPRVTLNSTATVICVSAFRYGAFTKPASSSDVAQVTYGVGTTTT